MAKEEKKQRDPDITFFHPDLLEVPEDCSSPFLKGYRCKSCGQLDFPNLNPCPNCWGEEFEIVPLSRRGKLYSYADIFIGQPGLQTPYIIGYVDLPENLRIFAMLDGEVGSFQCGEEVELTVGEIRKNRDGLPILSYKFKKVNG
ncbi:Zn-ribbon domain-containing OB-fold protein [Desulforhabdus sp. TSK]|uniref:Zn-ribbon domain-containing OB-fold protein n=1 Tax=Desulforhabdus sp. TSK TaxID=2925014 RepID=UPI001FC87B92|nr:OB-fold domain-containing protein [Desulforhabdus sp. TSK]GKT07433.1 transcriptional regulator [Desulforhabdus sp. TSK]